MKSFFYRIMIVALFALGAFPISCSHDEESASPSEQTPKFYVDAVNGSDSNTGTDTSSPWQSLGKVSSSAIPSGATVYLKRESVWNEQLTIPSSGMTIDAYGTGALPIIDGSKEITGWTDEGGCLYSASVTLGTDEVLGNLSENGAMMSFLEWDTDATATFSGASPGTYSYEYPSAVYIKPAASPLGNEYRASVKIYGITATSRSDVVVKNIEITRFSLHGIHFQDCVNCEVYDSVISRGGGATIAPNLYAGNGIEFDNTSSNGVVDGVSVSDIFDSGISPQTWAANQTMSSISIRNSQISSCGFSGIEVSVLSNGGSTGSSITGVLISGMTITNSGRGWSGRRYGTEGHGIRVKADYGAGTMSVVQVDTTSISGSIGDGVKLAGDIGTVSMHRMNITGNANGISLEEPDATGAKLHLTSSLVHHNAGYGIFYNSPTAAGFELFQNTFADNAGINLAVFNQSGIGKIQNNIFYGSTAMTHLYAESALSGAVVDNNCYNNFVNMFGYAGTAYSTVLEFESATGFESNGTGGTVGLTDPAAGDFTVTSASQCKTLGSSSVGVTDDYSGYPFSNPPSSGAYQYQ